MNNPATMTLVLTGGRAGQTCVLNHRQFVNGEHVMYGDLASLAGAIKYMGRVYQAFPKGSAELAQHQEPKHGKAGPDTRARRRQAESVPSDVLQDGAPEEAPAVGHGATAAGDPAAEHNPQGNGRQDARLREAVMSLDPKNDDHWTSSGTPRMDAVEVAYGSADVTRKDVDRVLPGFARPEQEK